MAHIYMSYSAIAVSIFVSIIPPTNPRRHKAGVSWKRKWKLVFGVHGLGIMGLYRDYIGVLLGL